MAYKNSFVILIDGISVSTVWVQNQNTMSDLMKQAVQAELFVASHKLPQYFLAAIL